LTTDLALPLVSAVVPTRNRPDLVCRAVRSALNQTYPNLEVVVVVDGPDPATVAALEELSEPRVRIIALSENVGGSEARNIGAREARGEWVALLDDDDEWLPEKVERQVASVNAEKHHVVFCATQYLDNRAGRQSVKPRMFPSDMQHISEYLFCELDYIGRRDCFLQTSTWMARRSFFISMPFTRGLRKNQDTDWLLRAFAGCSGRSVFISEPLAIFHRQPGLPRVSTTRDWEHTFRWAERNSNLFTCRAKSFILMTECARSANRQGCGIKTLMLLWSKCSPSARRSPRLLFCMAIALLQLAANSLTRRRV
jgi:glycosyltransferase involved in cell wall biosynthesis